MKREELKKLLEETMDKKCDYCGEPLRVFFAHRPHAGIVPEHLTIKVSCPACESRLDEMIGYTECEEYEPGHVETGGTFHDDAPLVDLAS